MALWLDSGAEPQTEKEKLDLEAIVALKESAAFELKVFSLLLFHFLLLLISIILQFHNIIFQILQSLMIQQYFVSSWFIYLKWWPNSFYACKFIVEPSLSLFFGI